MSNHIVYKAYKKQYLRLQTTQPTLGGAVTVVWQTMCKLCRPLPPSAILARLTFFLESQSCGPAERLIKAGDDSRLHVVEPPRGRSFIWQIGVNTSIQDRRQVDRGFLWSRVSCTRQR